MGQPDVGDAAVTARLLTVAAFFLALWPAPAQSLRPLHVSAGGILLDDSNRPVALRGVNRSGTGSGNADATATDADYAAQNRLLSMNVVRVFVNAAWWNSNIQVPIANQKYQDYIDGLIQRIKKYGNYALILKAGQFPDAPCGSDGKNCPAFNQGDLNCQANASVCADQDTTGNNIDTAFTFWTGFAKKYASDPAVLYDTWEDMHSTDADTWNSNQNELIATIRAYAPQSLIFVEDTASAFDSIASGALPDLTWPNLVWTFHVFNASTASCTEPASPRYANWPQNIDALVSFAQLNGHAGAITEWGGCNDAEPYHTNVAGYARLHSLGLIYFDSSNVISSSGANYALTDTGSKVAQAFTSLAAATSGPAPSITLVANAEGEAPVIAPNTWVEIKGSNLAPAGDTRIWLTSDFFSNRMPDQLDGVSVTVNNKPAFVYYISPSQVNILTPPDAIQGPVQVKVTNAGLTSAAATVNAHPLSLSFFVFSPSPYAAAVHTSGALIGPASLYPGYTTPAKPGETIEIYANGFGPTDSPVASGSIFQGGSLTPLPAVTIGGIPATVTFAGLVFPGEFQLNVMIPPNAPDGDLALTAAYNGASTQSGVLLTVQH